MQTIDTGLISSGWQIAGARADAPRSISTREAARQAGVSTATIRRWIQRGYLEATRTAQGYLVDASGLEVARDMARARRVKPAQQDERADRNQQADSIVSEQPSAGPEPNDLVWSPLPPADVTADPVVPASTLPPAPPGSASALVWQLRSADRARVLEGLQRSIILEQAKYQRAARRRNRNAMQSCADRLADLYQRLDDIQQDLNVERQPAWQLRLSLDPLRALRPQAHFAALFSPSMFARIGPSRRTFNVATLLILNGFLMMLMNFIA